MKQRKHQTGRYAAAAGMTLLVCVLLATLPAYGIVPLAGGGSKGALQKYALAYGRYGAVMPEIAAQRRAIAVE